MIVNAGLVLAFWTASSLAFLGERPFLGRIQGIGTGIGTGIGIGLDLAEPKPRLWAASKIGNVVLRPSDDPEAFDSFKIGGVRVHRYVGDDENDQEPRYVMWYHGRSKNFDGDKILPPLSTGRIGRATSRNGLIWEKQSLGSESEDVQGVSLGLNQDWWTFDTAHVGLGQVLLPMQTPAVMAEGGVYIMYFFGGNMEDTPLSDYLQNVPESAKGSTVKGMKMKIGVAVSQDGISWGRVEGDDPSGACLAPYDATDPNQKGVASMRDDDNSFLRIDEELYCAWPEVVVRIPSSPKGANRGTKEPSFLMYYSTMRKSDYQKCIACAVSTDGFRWLKRGICVEPDEEGADAGGCARCNVFQKASYDEDSREWKLKENEWIMLYEGVCKVDKKHKILMAESTGGRRWNKVGVVLNVAEAPDAWDSGGVGSPHVIRFDDGSMRMYYVGQSQNGSTAVGVAKLPRGSPIGQWEREQSEFSLL